MKRCVTAIGVFFLVTLAVISCREHPSPASGKRPLPPSATASAGHTAGLNNAAGCDSTLAVVEALENQVRADPRDGNAVQALVKAAFDSVSGCFITAGKGTFNRSHPQAAQEAGRTMAAQYDAKRWTLYLKSRSLGLGTTMFGQNIAGEITYSSTLCTRNKGDTLVLLVKVPLGSVIVN